MIYVFSNVQYPVSRKIETAESDVLIFINKAYSADYYRNSPGYKILIRREDKPDFGPALPWMNENVDLGGGVWCEMWPAIRREYDWRYHCRSDKSRGPTTGYMAVRWAESRFPGQQITLVNFGYEVKRSTFRCEYHNWQFEAEALAKFPHVFTAETADRRKHSVYVVTTESRGENEALKPVIRRMKERGYRVNVMYRKNKAVWDDCADLDRSVQPRNADAVVQLRFRGGATSPAQQFQRQIELAVGDVFGPPEEAIQVVYVADERAVPLLKMSAATVLHHNPGAVITVLCAAPLGTGFLEIVVDTAGYTFRRNERDRVSAAAYLKLFVPEYVKTAKAIYMDVDTLCCGSLRPLWDTHVDYVGICHSHNTGLRQQQALGLDKYGLTAMLLLNCDACRRIKFTQTLMRCVPNLATPAGGFFHDETTLNAVYSDILSLLPLKYCRCVNRDYSGYADAIPEEEAVILHYIGGQKEQMRKDYDGGRWK